MVKKNFLDIYKNVYKLPELFYEEEVDFDFFRQCRQDYNFATIAIYNERREILLLRDLNKNIGWELVGGYVEKEENVENAVNRIVAKEVGIEIDELEPVAILTNIFKWKNNAITHRGIAFIALCRGRIKDQPANIKSIFTKTPPEKLLYQNKKILEITKKIIGNKSFQPPYNEIESTKKFYIPYLIHRLFINSFFGKSVSEKIKNKTLEIICGSPKSIIDVCCGNDDFVFFLEKTYNPDICLANDISWKILSFLRKKQKKSEALLVNHNVLDLPFREKFDLVMFKNSLHHISKTEQNNLIENLVKISRQLIIIDINDPNKSGFFAKLWHWYYVYFLGDQGKNFSTLDEIKDQIEEIAKEENKEINSGIIKTIKGDYFYISLNDISQGEEIELKARIENEREVNKIKKKLIKLGATFVARIEENDIYFTAPHRDFIKTKECLRIREKENCSELTYKGPTTIEMQEKKQFWKSEINISINHCKEEIISLFGFLNFKKIIEVRKKRERYILNSHTINIDNVKGAGYFLEIEKIAKDKKEREKILEGNIGLLNKLGLGEKDIVNKPYRDIVLEKINYQ